MSQPNLFRKYIAGLNQARRDLDHDVLFPAIRKAAECNDHALGAIRLQILTDKAWQRDHSEFSKRDQEIICEIRNSGMSV